MNPHLIRIPRLTPLTTRRLSRRDLQLLRRQADGAFDAEVFGFGALEEFLADFFEGGDFAAGQGDADLMGCLNQADQRVSCGVQGYAHEL